jgi:hypothetical protein
MHVSGTDAHNESNHLLVFDPLQRQYVKLKSGAVTTAQNIQSIERESSPQLPELYAHPESKKFTDVFSGGRKKYDFNASQAPEPYLPYE